MHEWDKSDCVAFNLNHFKYKTIGWCSEHFYMSVSGFIYVLPKPDRFCFKYFLFRKTNSLRPILFGFVLPLCSFFFVLMKFLFYIKKSQNSSIETAIWIKILTISSKQIHYIYMWQVLSYSSLTCNMGLAH